MLRENMKMLDKFEQDGWVIEDFRMYKVFTGIDGKRYEIDIEFCIGDFCVGIYDADSLALLEDKIREPEIVHAYATAVQLQGKYEKRKELHTMLKNLTWRCEICKEERPDHKISVLTYPLKHIGDRVIAERNLKYCNDNWQCHKLAQDIAGVGAMSLEEYQKGGDSNGS